MISVLVPLSIESWERDRNWAWLRGHWLEQFPGWELVEQPDPGRGGWSKGRAVNQAARRAAGDTFVLADADVWVRPDVLREAVAADAPWVVPHRTVFRLDRDTTETVLTGQLPLEPSAVPRANLDRRGYRGVAGGGLTVLTREAFETVRGVDPRFIGWGGEDVCLARALDTLVGRHERLAGDLWHFWHPPQDRPGGRAPDVNDRLSGRYLEAVDKPDEMRALIAEWEA